VVGVMKILFTNSISVMILLLMLAWTNPVVAHAPFTSSTLFHFFAGLFGSPPKEENNQPQQVNFLI
jgi:hypothetical protein